MTPRDYQSIALAKIDAGWQQFQKQLLVAPTGSGKTIIFSFLAHANPSRTLILAHREELIDQAIAKLRSATGLFAGKEKAEYHASPHDRCVVASIQSMIRRLDRWPADHFSLIICDEAHHSISASWQTVLTHFNARVLGVTATPDRGDKRELGTYYENIAHEIQFYDLVDAGYLAAPRVKCIPLEIDLGSVKQTAGDYDADDLASALDPYLDQIARRLAEASEGRKTLCFLPLIITSQKFTEACQSAGLTAMSIDGQSPNRAEILSRFARGEFQVLSNAMLLTEGYDCPDIGAIVILRPTRSRPLYCQMVGRGTRVTESKTDLILADFLWLHERHSIIRPANLIATDDHDAEAVNFVQWKAGGGDLRELALAARGEREQKLLAELKAKQHRKAKLIDAQEFALANHSLAVAEYSEAMQWESTPKTDSQIKCLKRFGVDPESVRSKGHASALITLAYSQPATSKQKWVMRRAGWPNADKATKADAKQFFARYRNIAA